MNQQRFVLFILVVVVVLAGSASTVLAQEEGATTLGVAYKYNPFSPRINRGDRLWVEAVASLGLYPLDETLQRSKEEIEKSLMWTRRKAQWKAKSVL